MVWQYGSGREQICAPQMSKVSGNLTSSGTLYFWIQFRNDVGFNLPSDSASINYSPGDGIEIQLPGDCKRNGENILQYSISLNTIDDASTAKVILNLDFEDLSLPHTIILTEDTHITLEEAVTTFPTGSNRLDGLVKLYSPTGLVYKYKASSTLPPNNTTVIAADIGNWEQTYDGFVSFVGNTEEDTNGANLNVLDILDANSILTKAYSLDGSAGPTRTYWLRNDTTETISQGTRVGFTVSVNGEPASEEFESLIKIIFDGYVDPLDGQLDTVLTNGTTPMDDLGIVKDYQFGRTDLILPKPLEPGVAYQVRIFPQFNSYELQSVPLSGTQISILGFFFDEAGAYNDASALVGNTILPENEGLRRVYPSSGLSVFVDEGSGTVGGFFFKDVGSNVIPGLLDNTIDQQIAINNNGSTYLNGLVLESNEDLRALVSTEAGESITSPFTALGVTANNAPDISITVEYPNTIDFLYDDVIAGTPNKGTFNAEEIAIYISNGSEIRQFLGLAPTNTVSDTFTVSWVNGTIVSSVKTTNFGLWAPIPPTIITTTTSGSVVYEVAVGFVYLGNSVTGISHKESDGVIPELSLSIAEIASFAQYWRQPINSYDDLKAVNSETLLDGQNHMIENESGSFQIWTWDQSNNSIADNQQVIIPNDNPTNGRWILASGAGGSSIDKIVTFRGEVVVGPDGYVVTSPLGGPITPGSVLDDYLEDNVIGLSKIDLSNDINLSEQSNKYQILTATNGNTTVFLYNGGSIYGREHFIYSKNSTSDIVIQYGGVVIETLTDGQQIHLLWDKSEWLIL